MKHSGDSASKFIAKQIAGWAFLVLIAGMLSGYALEPLSVRNPGVAAQSGANGDSGAPLITPDGRYVSFSSAARNLVTNDNAWPTVDAFLRDQIAGLTILVSENLTQTGGGNSHSTAMGVSTSGRYVLFESIASDLSADDTNELNDIFLRDIQTRSTYLVSRGLNGEVANNRSSDPVMTPDGRFVAFVSYATNLVANDTNSGPDVFVRDLQTQTTTLMSVGATNANASMSTPAISADGRWVAFFSSARGLMTGVSNISRGELYLRDRTTSTTLWPSMNAIALVRSNMQFISTPVPMHPVLSIDGRYVTFTCGWTNNATLPPNGTTPATVVMQFDATALTTTVIDTNGYPPSPYHDEVYGPEATPDGRFVAYAVRVTNGVSPYCALRCWDRQTGTSVGVSMTLAGGVVTNSEAIMPGLSVDGRYVTFFSDATNLVGSVVSKDRHLYRRDLTLSTTELVDVDLEGVGSTANMDYERPGMSDDGQWIVFTAPDGNLIAEDGNDAGDIFIRDMALGTSALVSRSEESLLSTSGNAATLPGLISLSADGNRAAYVSMASDLIPADTNNTTDVFVWNRPGQSNQLVSVGLDGFPARGGMSFDAQLSANGRYLLFASSATNLVTGDTNGMADVFLRDLEQQQTTCVSVTTNGSSLASLDLPWTVMTPDARYIAFLTRTNPSGATYLLFWRNLISGETKLITANASIYQPISISTNGQRLAYPNAAGNSVVWNVSTGTTLFAPSSASANALISPSGNQVLYRVASQLVCYDLNAQTNLGSWPSTVSVKGPAPWSPDEHALVLVTTAALVSVDTNGVSDVYLCDLQTGTRSLVSARAGGGAAGNAASDVPMFSADGRFIAYRSQATDLLAVPTTAPGLFVFDRVTGSNRLVVARSAMPGRAWFSAPIINADGTTVAFKSQDSGLMAGDLNRNVDAFIGGVDVLSIADGDADGIPDWWLQQYFGHVNGQANDLSRAGDDADGDGLTNQQEFLAGTDPADATSALEIHITLTPPLGTNAVLSWPAQVGKNYRVQFSDDVASGNWQNLSVPAQISGGQGWVNVTRTNRTRVFRVRWEP